MTASKCHDKHTESNSMQQNRIRVASAERLQRENDSAGQRIAHKIDERGQSSNRELGKGAAVEIKAVISMKYHAEYAGEGIEYAWGILKKSAWALKIFVGTESYCYCSFRNISYCFFVLCLLILQVLIQL